MASSASCRAVLAAVLIGAWAPPGAGQEAASRDEFELKAAFLFNFARFCDWPKEAFASPDAPFVIGVLGKDPFGKHIDALEGKKVKERRVAVKRLSRAEELGDCHIAFFGEMEEQAVRKGLDAIRKQPVLTVGDREGFAQDGGVVNFYLDERRVAFEVNVQAAERSGVKPRSQLLKLARVVRDRERGG